MAYLYFRKKRLRLRDQESMFELADYDGYKKCFRKPEFTGGMKDFLDYVRREYGEMYVPKTDLRFIPAGQWLSIR